MFNRFAKIPVHAHTVLTFLSTEFAANSLHIAPQATSASMLALLSTTIAISPGCASCCARASTHNPRSCASFLGECRDAFQGHEGVCCGYAPHAGCCPTGTTCRLQRAFGTGDGWSWRCNSAGYGGSRYGHSGGYGRYGGSRYGGYGGGYGGGSYGGGERPRIESPP